MYLFKIGHFFGRFFFSVLWSGFASGNGNSAIYLLGIPILRIGRHIWDDPFSKPGVFILGIRIFSLFLRF